MSTRSEIIKIADELIREKGFNAFSFYDISKALGIKNASVHYHFPTKNDLGIAVVNEYLAKLEEMMADSADKEPTERINVYLSIYTSTKAEGRICLVGSLASDLQTVDSELKVNLKQLVDKILNWVTDILADGQTRGVFAFSVVPRTKALMIITNMLASLQLTRLTDEQDFETIKQTIIKDITK